MRRRMTAKRKISVTVSADVLALVDQAARETGTTRSYTIERWLRSGSLRAAERSLEDATAAYYAALRPAERDEADALAHATSRAARRAHYDEDPPKTTARTRDHDAPRRRGRGSAS